MLFEGALTDVLRRHAELEGIYGGDKGGDLISGWQVENPWARALKAKTLNEIQDLSAERYVYLEEDEKLIRGFKEFHERADGAEPEALFIGSGSSPLLVTFAAYLAQQGASEVFYLPPLYFSLHAALRLFGIRARPVSSFHGFEKNCRPHWPEARCVLLLCDPIWYAGIPVPEQIMAEIAAWQSRTGSLVMVDGSFQYMRWDGRLDERSALLPGPTMRIVCPTKALGIHGFRCAYAIMPQQDYAPFEVLYSYLYASASLGDLAFARVALGELNDRTVINDLMSSAASRHRTLRDAGLITAEWSPEGGYFVFEEVRPDAIDLQPLMDGSYFEQPRHAGYYRINLLSPRLARLYDHIDGCGLVEFNKNAAMPPDG
jgi:aspartate/methionine/tyrosine aminotransferase